MSSAEPARHSLYSRLEDVLGEQHAETLMTYLPNDHNDQVATKVDIVRLEATTNADFARLEARFDRFEERMDQMQRTYVVTVVSSMTALTAIFSLVVGFMG